jgi:hypothetical protein
MSGGLVGVAADAVPEEGTRVNVGCAPVRR